MAMPPLLHLSAAASERQLSALSPVLETLPEAETQESVPTPKPLSPVEEDDYGPPPVGQMPSSSLDETVVGPSRASPPDDFKDRQALLRQVAKNLGLEVEEMAKQLLDKAVSSGSEPLLTLLSHRNTPSQGYPKDQNLATHKGRPVAPRWMEILLRGDGRQSEKANTSVRQVNQGPVGPGDRLSCEDPVTRELYLVHTR
ncbi:hypothetical protein UY3_00200 [Chelonia mydas]|uniref:Uncharacterized protein n=1 Tax=Chelonia mydas TaxID=8469 RepID=M7BXE1_CHEMY|nr:hypothetical protein UY3_00200 [Chelonia mydas]